MKLRALHNYIVLEIVDLPERETAKGVTLPVNQFPYPVCGVVTDIGPDARIYIGEGERVLFPPFGIGEQFSWQGRQWMVILDHQLLGVLEAYE